VAIPFEPSAERAGICQQLTLSFRFTVASGEVSALLLQAQARALGWKEIKEFIGSAGKGLRADRERALLRVAYETLARRGELVALEVRDIEFWTNGTGLALIRRGKTDAKGQGRAYLSRETVKWLKIWLEHAKIAAGPIFRRLIGRDQIRAAAATDRDGEVSD
jgi:integrase